MMTNRITNGQIDFVVGSISIEKMKTSLYDQYHKVEQGAITILFKKLIFLRLSWLQDTNSFIAKFRVFYLHLSNDRLKLEK